MKAEPKNSLAQTIAFTAGCYVDVIIAFYEFYHRKLNPLDNFLRINQKTILTFVADLITYGTGLKLEAKITNQLGLELKRLTKLTKENFAKSGFMVLNNFW